MIKDLKTGKFYKEVRNLKHFLEVYPDDDREYKNLVLNLRKVCTLESISDSINNIDDKLADFEKYGITQRDF